MILPAWVAWDGPDFSRAATRTDVWRTASQCDAGQTVRTFESWASGSYRPRSCSEAAHRRSIGRGLGRRSYAGSRTRP
jgi:hypothetical protein